MRVQKLTCNYYITFCLASTKIKRTKYRGLYIYQSREVLCGCGGARVAGVPFRTGGGERECEWCEWSSLLFPSFDLLCCRSVLRPLFSLPCPALS